MNPSADSFIEVIRSLVWFVVIFLIIYSLKKNKNKATSKGKPSSSSQTLIDLITRLSQEVAKKKAMVLPGSRPSVGSPRSLFATPALLAPPPPKLSQKNKYLQVALNSTLHEARSIIYQLPQSHRIILEAGTPLMKIYGNEAIRAMKSAAWPGAYIVADIKTTDLAVREVAEVAQAGANAATCLGVAPVETINEFIAACRKYGLDSMVDMMNVDNALIVLKKLKKVPDVVMLHRGVDETEFSKERQIPFYQIKQIKGAYDIMVSIAGGDQIREVQRAVFNDADIVVAWKDFYRLSSDTATLANQFLHEVK
ncbi:orotidine 5'-phosphate decarboxylase [Patescibacteria group bacterium]|nr:orotidine 5'-phosphate decarboxylase [Patescibacteria group bacterium]MBU0963978.1 orotidine 5'-phosphate decarboxylase [Patescibacteria group bacterium]